MSGPIYGRSATVMAAELRGALVAPDPGSEGLLEFGPVAAFVWRALEQPKTFDQLRDCLLAEYDVSPEECSEDLLLLLHDLRSKGLVEEHAVAPPGSGSRRPEMTSVERATEPRVASPELALLVRSCASAFGPGAPAVQTEIDWPLFLRLARFHRVQGLVWSGGLKHAMPMPSEIAAAIEADASDIARANVQSALECRRLLRRFDGVGIAPLFVKGLPLGMLAYGDATAKAAVDIDLVVAAEQLQQAADVLRSDGYRLEQPSGPYDPGRLRAWHGPGKESTWVRTDPWSVVDLHTRLSDHPRLIPAIGPSSPRRMVEVSKGIQLPTLQEKELFAYLCVHGASSAWFRLKWITDLAALLHRENTANIAHLHRRSQELGAGRAAGQALLLADALYGTLAENPELRKALRSDRMSRWLCDRALRQLAGRGEPVEPTARAGGTAWIHLTQLFLLPGWSFKASEFVRQARAALR